LIRVGEQLRATPLIQLKMQMPKHNPYQFHTLAAIISALLISACGGGGGGGTAATDKTTDTPVKPVTSTAIQVDVPTATYALDSEHLKAFNYLNEVRSKCGFGKLAHNVALDQAAFNHSSYISTWYGSVSEPHIEYPAYTGFTGSVALDRAKFVGYSTSASEVLEVGNAAGKYSVNLTYLPKLTTDGKFKDIVQSWLNTPYHGWSVLAPAIDVGMGWVVKDTVDPFTIAPAL
jgi:uncharacterized protein YkwD